MKLRCAIVDDDKVFTDILEYYISKTGFIELAGTYGDAPTAYNGIDFNSTDFLFVDVEMPGTNGMEFIDSLAVSPPVILVSRKKEYGADAFNYESIDYLHKPVTSERFFRTVNRVKKFFGSRNRSGTEPRESLFVRQDRMWIKIPIRDILYIKADNNDIVLNTPDKSYKTHSRLKDLYDYLPAGQFLQVHRSYIVQLSRVDKVDGEVIEVNNRTIPVSKTFIKEMYRRLNLLPESKKE